MIYYYSQAYANHWHSLSEMIQDVYGHLEKHDTLMMLGNYLFQNPTQYKSMSDKVIVYQSEPLVENHWWKTDHILKQLESADEVWDYDIENILLLRKHGIEAKFRPPTYSDKLKTVTNSENPDIDVLFYGTLTRYRYDAIAAVLENWNTVKYDLKFVFVNNFFGQQLDELIGRSKIILNLNPYDGETRQQQTRISHSLINDKCVLSEKSSVNYFGNQIESFKGNKELIDKLYALLLDGDWKKYTTNNYKENSFKMIREGENILNIPISNRYVDKNSIISLNIEQFKIEALPVENAYPKKRKNKKQTEKKN